MYCSNGSGGYLFDWKIMKDRGIVPNAKLKLHLRVLWHKTLKWGLCPSKMVPNAKYLVEGNRSMAFGTTFSKLFKIIYLIAEAAQNLHT